jgi:hypothetical protein
VTVNYSTSDGTAISGIDYTNASGPLTLPPGTITETVYVSTIDDSIYEGAESFYVNLTNPVNATIVDNQGFGTIIDNEPLP